MKWPLAWFLYIKVQLNFSIEWKISLKNKIDTDIRNQAVVLLVQDAYFGPWSTWSLCSKSCIGLDEQYGQRSRQRTCFEGQNGGQSCYDLLGISWTFTVNFMVNVLIFSKLKNKISVKNFY